MLLQYLLEDLTNVEISGDTNQEINKIEYDSKKIEKGDVFVAINGYNEDGKEYIDDAIKRGAIAIVYDGETEKRDNVTYIKVEDARIALAQMAAQYFHQRWKNEWFISFLYCISGYAQTTLR